MEQTPIIRFKAETVLVNMYFKLELLKGYFNTVWHWNGALTILFILETNVALGKGWKKKLEFSNRGEGVGVRK